jgi:hypothetical protein
MSDTSDGGPHEEAARDADEQPRSSTASESASESTSKTARKPARKPAKRPANKPARKPARSGAPRAEARKPADDHGEDDRSGDRNDARDDDRGQRDRDSQRGGRDDRDGADSQGGQGRRDRPKGTRLAVLAAEQLVDLTGKAFEGIVGLSKSDDGWSVSVEVLEMRRIPSTTDVIAVYQVDVDQDGDLTGYRRLHRFLRGEAGEDR